MLSAALSSGSASIAMSALPCARSASPRDVLLGRMMSATPADFSIAACCGFISPKVTVVAPCTFTSARAGPAAIAITTNAAPMSAVCLPKHVIDRIPVPNEGAASVEFIKMWFEHGESCRPFGWKCLLFSLFRRVPCRDEWMRSQIRPNSSSWFP